MAYIIKPLVSEKANTLTDKLNQFSFIVRPEANKLQIKAEVEALYGVSVLSVNTIKYAGKSKARYTKAGLVRGRSNAIKKAIQTLKKG